MKQRKTWRDKPGTPQYGGVLRIGNTTLLPSRMGVPGRINVGTQQLEPIVEHFLRVDKTGQLLPHLIESWEYSTDGTQLTLKARKNIKFHDGTDFDAKAVKWNLLKARETNGTLQLLSSVDLVDEYTVLLNMKCLDNHFLPTLAYSPDSCFRRTPMKIRRTICPRAPCRHRAV